MSLGSVLGSLWASSAMQLKSNLILYGGQIILLLLATVRNEILLYTCIFIFIVDLYADTDGILLQEVKRLMFIDVVYSQLVLSCDTDCIIQSPFIIMINSDFR